VKSDDAMNTPLPDTRPFAAFEWQIALRYLRARRKEGFISVISLFSFLGIMLGVATLIVVMSVFNGFHAELLDKILGFSGHASVYRQDQDPIANYKEVQTRIAKVPGVTRVIALVEGQSMVSSLKTATGALVRGISEDDLIKLPSINNKDLRTQIASKDTVDEKASLIGFEKADGIAIGEGMARRHQVGLGSPITLIAPNGPDTVIGNTPRIRDYTVVAIFKMGMSDYDDSVVYMPISEAQDFFSANNGATGLEVMVDDPGSIQTKLASLLDAAGPDLTVQTWQNRNVAFFNALAVERNVVIMVVSLVVLVAALNIISGLFMLVKDKGSNIAILRTMGATKGSIMRVFFLTGAAIGTFGTFVGLIVGLVICANANNIRNAIQWLSGVDPFNPEFYYLAQLPAKVDYNQTFWIVVFALIMSFLATLYPSWKAAKLDPVEALRYE
jgi:lipoprotein-releasing system permease protein